MSINIGARLVYGIPYRDLPEEILDEVDEMLYEGTLDYASPYYNAPNYAWIVGVTIPCWNESPWDLRDAIEEAYGKLPSSFRARQIAGLYVSPHVT